MLTFHFLSIHMHAHTHTHTSGETDIVSAGAETTPNFHFFFFFFFFFFFLLRVCSLIGVNAAVTQLSRLGSGNGDTLSCASAEALVFSGDRLFWPVECTFSLPSFDGEVAIKRLPTKRPVGQRWLDELFSAPAKRATPPLQESTANARDLEFSLETKSSSTTGTKLEGCSSAKSYDIGEALASEETSDVAFYNLAQTKLQR